MNAFGVRFGCGDAGVFQWIVHHDRGTMPRSTLHISVARRDRCRPARRREVFFAKAPAMDRSKFPRVRTPLLACLALLVFCWAAPAQEPKKKEEPKKDPAEVVEKKTPGTAAPGTAPT